MKSRLQLHEILCECLGSRNVYFSPPPSVELSYPCIVYKRDGINAVYADNAKYNQSIAYSVIVISYTADVYYLSEDLRIETSSIHQALMDLPYCAYDRSYVADGLYHDAYTIHF